MQSAQTIKIIADETEFRRELRQDSGQLAHIFHRPKRSAEFARQLGVLRTLHQPEGKPENKLERSAGTIDKLLNCICFWYPVICKAKFAAAELPAVKLQPEVRIEAPGVKHRYPIAVLESACSHQNHISKIGEKKVKIKLIANCELKSAIRNLQSMIVDRNRGKAGAAEEIIKLLKVLCFDLIPLP